MRAGKVLLAVVTVPTLIAACGDDDDDGGGGAEESVPATEAAGATAAAGDGASIEIADLTFPAETRVAAGATVAVTNTDSTTHTVTADDGAFSIEVPAGETVELTAPAAGTYPYHCNFHDTMTGTLVVE
jgi:plastocyanin